MNNLPKMVFSRTLEKADWNNSRLVKDNVAQEVTRWKEQPGRELALFGSSDLASTLIRHDLIDEYRILVTPFVLGQGTPVFKNIEDRIRLKLFKATPWSPGTIALFYSKE